MNKTLRDLLDLYTSLPKSDLSDALSSATNPAATGESTVLRNSQDELAAHVTRNQLGWLGEISKEHGVSIDVVLARLIAFAMQELDDEEIFENRPHLAKNTADLYSDCDIFSNIY